MTKIVSIHSFRGGTGKSNICANLAALLALHGKRVGIIDTDIQSPGIHVLFGINSDAVEYALNDYLWGRCSIEQAAIDVTDRLGVDAQGKILLIPASVNAGEITRILREGCDARVLTRGMHSLINVLNLDLLLIDTHPGLNEETLLSLAISQTLVTVLRPDQQDYIGTYVTVEVASALTVPQTIMLVNKIPPMFDLEIVKQRVVENFQSDIVEALPHSFEMMELSSTDLFVMHYPDHPITTTLQRIVQRLPVQL